MKIYYFIFYTLTFIQFNCYSQCCVSLETTQTAQNLINTYYPVANDFILNVGQTSIPLESVPVNDIFGNSYGTTPISPGDLLLIIQMQGADFNSDNSQLYGAGISNSGPDFLGATGYTNINSVGLYEYVVAQNYVPLSGGLLNIIGACSNGGVLNNYYNQEHTDTNVQKRFQVIRVPSFNNLTLSNDIITSAWNGKVGGVIVVDVNGNLDINNKSINATGKGFRGSYMNVRPSNDNTNIEVSTDLNISASKAEGICGSPRFMWDGLNQVDNGINWMGYPGGDFGRGAVGNAGGGGNIHNAGGGGGGNGGSGGVGGNGWQGAGGPSTFPNGGRPGSSVPNIISRIIMGGGGGGGDANNALSGVKGGVGGGIILVKANKIIGSGSIISNGSNGQPGNLGGAPDGAGGGGAGGTILVQTLQNNSANNLNLIALGGNGGNALNSSSDHHGPGGGGGGGIIFYNTPGIVALNISVAQGIHGLTNDGNGISWGSNDGIVGNAYSFIPSELPNSFSIIRNPTPIAQFSITEVCEGINTEFTNLSTVSNDNNSSITSYLWDFGDGSTSIETNPTHTYSTFGSYVVTLTVTTNLGCFNFITNTVNVLQKFQQPQVIENQSFCNQAVLSDIIINGVSIQWYNSLTSTMPLPINTELISGTTYYATSNGSNMCESIKTPVTITLNVPENPIQEINQSFCNPIKIKDIVSVGQNIQWFSSDSGGIPLDLETDVVFGTTYYSSQTIDGCESEIRSQVLVTLEECDVIINNYISVNSDDTNEYLHIEGIERYPKNTIEIINRWGVLVYKMEGYNNSTNVFKGISEGRFTINSNAKLPEGTYFYILNYTKSNGSTIQKTGYLYITIK